MAEYTRKQLELDGKYIFPYTDAAAVVYDIPAGSSFQGVSGSTNVKAILDSLSDTFLKGNTQLKDILRLGTAGQVLTINEDGTDVEWVSADLFGPSETKDNDTTSIIVGNMKIADTSANGLIFTGGTNSFNISNGVENVDVQIAPSIGTVSKSASGLCPQLPNESTTTKFLRLDGTWQVPSYIANTDNTAFKLVSSISGNKKTDSTIIKAASSSALLIKGDTNKFIIGDGTNYIEVPITPSINNNVISNGATTSGYLAKFSAANTITNGPQLSSTAIQTVSTTTKFLALDGSWQTPKYTSNTDNTSIKIGDTKISDTSANGLVFTGGTNKFTVSNGSSSADVTITPSIGLVSNTSNGLVKSPANNDSNVSSTKATSAYYVYGIASKNSTPNWYKLPDNAFADTIYSNFVKSGTGAAAGLVPAPPTTEGTAKYLREDGTWATPPNDNTTYKFAKLLYKTSSTATAADFYLSGTTGTATNKTIVAGSNISFSLSGNELTISGPSLSGYATESEVDNAFTLNYAVLGTLLAGEPIDPSSEEEWTGLSTLTTTSKDNLVAAINEVKGGVTDLAKTVTANQTIKINKISAPTTSNGTTYGYGTNGQVLKSNGTSVYWTSDSNSHRPVQVGGTQILASNTTALNLVAGNNITLTPETNSSGAYTGKVTINSSASVTSVESADKLSTSRSLWGNNFNGTADVDGSIHLPNAKYVCGKTNAEEDLILLGLNANNDFLIGYGDSEGLGFRDTIVYGTSIKFRYGESKSEIMRIASDGNVGIGTSSPSQKLDVSGSINVPRGTTTDLKGYKIDGNTILRMSNSNDNLFLSANGGKIYLRPNGSATDTGQVAVDTSGNLETTGTVTGSSVYTNSDIRLKDNITPISDSIREFTWKKDGDKSYGFIALELEKTNPELVTTKTDGYKTVNYDAAICLTIAKLENRIKELEEMLKSK